jgi:phosphatidylinositol glycan class N
MNSVGVLPTNYLSGEEAFRVSNLFTNAKQILAQFHRKAGMTEFLSHSTKAILELKRQTTLGFKPFTLLENSSSIVLDIQRLIDQKSYKEAEMACKRLIDLSLDGLYYYQTYVICKLITDSHSFIGMIGPF